MEESDRRDGCGYTWGTALALIGGAAIGYWAGRSNGGFGGPGMPPPPYGYGYAGGNSTMEHHVNTLMDSNECQNRIQDTKAIMEAINTGNTALAAQVNQLQRDDAAINVQQLINENNNFRNLDNQICGVNSNIAAEAMATRAEIAAFRSEYNRDRADDYKTRWTVAEGKLAAVPTEMGLNTINQKLNCMEKAFTGCAIRSVPACPTTTSYSPCGCGA